MNKNILILAMVTFTLLISGCQELPPAPNPTTKVETTTPPENQPPTVENKPLVKPEPKTETPTPEPPKVVSAGTQTQPQKLNLKVYFPDDAGINLVAVKRTIEIKDESEKYLAAVKLLMVRPEEKDLTIIFPKNAKINKVTFENGTAFVDLDKNITKSFAGGSTGEELLVGSVVKTLTEFKEVQQVQFLIDGKEIETLSGHMDLSEPIKRADL